jgi:rubrerythrin
MEQQTTLGRNRTGVQMSPIDAERMQSASEDTTPDESDGREYLRLRQSYQDDDGLGSVPAPGTMKGVLKSGVDALTGKRPQVFIDKLGERLAFERGGVRLYDTLLAKCEGSAVELPANVLDDLRRFRSEEAQHLHIVTAAIERLGADPTAQTPCADLVGVESMGLVQAMNDPRTNILQSLHVMLDAEVLDNAGWEMLIELADALGHDDIAGDFDVALRQESEHLARVRSLLAEMTMADAGSQDSETVVG